MIQRANFFIKNFRPSKRKITIEPHDRAETGVPGHLFDQIFVSHFIQCWQIHSYSKENLFSNLKLRFLITSRFKSKNYCMKVLEHSIYK